MTGEGRQELLVFNLNREGASVPDISDILTRESTVSVALTATGVGTQLFTCPAGYVVVPFFARVESNEAINPIRFAIVDGDPAVAGFANRWYWTVGAGIRDERYIFPGVCDNVLGVFLDVDITLLVAPSISIVAWRYRRKDI